MPRTTIPDSQMAEDDLRAMGLVLKDGDSRTSIRFIIAKVVNNHGGIDVILPCRTLGEVNAFLIGSYYQEQRRRTS